MIPFPQEVGWSECGRIRGTAISSWSSVTCVVEQPGTPVSTPGDESSTADHRQGTAIVVYAFKDACFTQRAGLRTTTIEIQSLIPFAAVVLLFSSRMSRRLRCPEGPHPVTGPKRQKLRSEELWMTMRQRVAGDQDWVRCTRKKPGLPGLVGNCWQFGPLQTGPLPHPARHR